MRHTHPPVQVTPALAATRSTDAARLLIRTTELGNLKFPLDREILTIGRRSTNDLCLNSRFISRYHARIINTPEGAILEDLNSQNGVTVNARRVRRQPLRSGDRIAIGPLQLRYIDLSDSGGADGNA